MYSIRFLATLFAIVALAFLANQATGTGTSSWYYRGTAVTSNTSLSLNTGDSLTIQCIGIAAGSTRAANVPLFAVLFATSSTSNPVITVTMTAAITPTPLGATVTASSGTLIYDSFNGAQATWAHWLFSSSIILPSFSTEINSVSRGILNVFIPKLISTDAGTMYCVYADGTTYLVSNLAFSNGFTLSLTTKSSSSTSTIKRSKYLEYSMLLMGASKLFL